MIDPLRVDQDPAPEPPALSAEDPPARPGAALSAARRTQGLSLGDIARQLKLSVRQIEALERDDYSAFSGMVFVRGFLRNYAKLLQMDAEALLAQIPAPSTGAAPAAAIAAPEPQGQAGRRTSRSAPGWLAGAAVLAALLLAAIYEGRQHQSADPRPGTAQPAQGGLANPQHADSPPPGLAADQAGAPTDLPQSAAGTVPAADAAPFSAAPGAVTTAPAAPAVADAALPVPSARPAAAPMPAAAPVASATGPSPGVPAAASVALPASIPDAGGTPAASAAPAQLRLEFEVEAWVEVKDASGAIIFSRLNSPGSEQLVQGRPPLQLLVGNAHGVRVNYRGRPVDLGPHTRVDVARLVLE
jgi:cytoskeleton protein RodZ